MLVINNNKTGEINMNEYAKKTTENGTTITLFLNLDSFGNHNGTYELEVIDIDGNESDKYDFYFTNERDAVSEYNQAVRDNS